MRTISEVSDVDARRFREEIVPAGEPVVLRGIAASWPAVRTDDIGGYLADRDSGARCDMLVAPPEAGGRFFYNGDMTGLNFERQAATVSAIVARLAAADGEAQPHAIAAQSVPADQAVPAFAQENGLPVLPPGVRPRLWIGNRIVVGAHHDMYSNIAVVAAGRRRFTLFPPDQVANLYIGPFEFTPAGTPVSLVDMDAPDPDRFPRFAAALGQARAADLAPGDAIYIPYMWWHHVRSLDAFNLLVNYWWNDGPAPQPGLAPIDALVHALLSFSGLPPEQRAAWAPMFAHFVFDADDGALDDVPADKRGIRGALQEDSKARLRRQLGALMGR